MLAADEYKRSDSSNARNDKKQIRSKYGEMTIDVPQDRNSSSGPKVVKKRQKDISNIEDKIISHSRI